MHPMISFGPVQLPAYGLCMLGGMVLAFVLSLVRLRSRGGRLGDLVILTAMSLTAALITAKLFFLLFSYGLPKAVGELLAGDFTCLTGGGIVFYGGLIGGFAAAMLTLRLLRCDRQLYLTAVVPCIPLAHAVGRVGCLLAGCCHGLPYTGPLAVTSVFAGSVTLFPIQAVEALANAGLGLLLLRLPAHRRMSGTDVLGVYGCAYAALRFVLEFFRGDAIRGSFLGLSASQWISIPVGIICAALLARGRHEKTAA